MGSLSRFFESESVKPECHRGEAYSVLDLSTTFHIVMSFSTLTPKRFNITRMNSLRFTCLQISSVFTFHLRSDVIITPSSDIFSTDLIRLPFSRRFCGLVFLLEKLKVMILHLVSFITILSLTVPAASLLRASRRKFVASPT